MLIYLRADSTA